MKSNIKVSIIVPIYNVEKYLRQCLDSVIDQTLEEIEIILVNDGSTDSSGTICDEYAAMDNRIVLIHKENAGLGAAYNTGLEIAKGEYIGFVESDDWVELNMFEELYNKAKEFDVDVVKSNFFDYNSVRQIDRKRHNLENLVPENTVFKIEEYPKIFLMHSSIWAGLYKKSFLVKEKIKFQTTKSASYQDFYFITLVLMKANIVVTYEHFLHYRQEEGHISSIARKDKMLLMFIEQFKNTYYAINDYYNYKSIESYFFIGGFRTCHHFYNQIMDEYKTVFFEQLAEVIKNFKSVDTTLLNEQTLKLYKRLKRKNDTNNYNIKVSIIVPIYNVEKYLRQCLDSVIDQTLEEIEIILVDDGSTDSSGTICDEYAAMDNRIVLIHKENAGLGAAYNTGLEIAKGEYIGFVESDDWVELNMFEELYNKAKEFDVDVVKSLYTNNYSNKPPRIVNKFHNCSYNNTVIVNNFCCPQYYHGHASHWSAIYKKELIDKNKLNFRETPGASCQDVSFAFLTFIYAKNIFIYTKSFYNYREDNEGSSKTKGYKIALASLDVRKYIRNIIEDKNLNKQYKELEAKKIYQALTNDYYYRTPFNKKIYFLRQISSLFKKYINEIDFYYFDEKEKRIFSSIANNHIVFFIKDIMLKKTKNNNEIGLKILGKYYIFYKRKVKGDRLLKIFGITLSSGKTINNIYTRKILGIPVFKKEINKNKVTKKYLFFNTENSKDIYKIQFLYFIPLYYKQNIKGDRLLKIFGITLSSGKTINNIYTRKVLGMPIFIKIMQKVSYAKNNTNLTEQDIFRIVANANACKELHSKTFPKYKNINIGKDIYIIATGPSLDYAPTTQGIHIACNRAIELNEKYNFNYLFMIDYQSVKDYIEKIYNINCVKFLGRYIFEATDIAYIKSIPEHIIINSNAELFYIEGPLAKQVYHDIELYPLYDSWSITFQAIHFALFTNPKRIFLIGCDTANNGYFNKKDKLDKINTDKLIDGYKKIKIYQETFYPNTEIISINPVGLKGLFKDLYTQDFLNKHNISNNNKILYENYIKE